MRSASNGTERWNVFRLCSRTARERAVLLVLSLAILAAAAVARADDGAQAEAAPVSASTATAGDARPADAGADVLSAPTATAGPGPERGDDHLVDRFHRGISRRLLSSAVWLDSFFGDERYTAETNESRFTVRLEAFREAGTGMDYRRPNYDVRLVLPQLRHKTHLVISGDPRDDPDVNPAVAGGPSVPPAPPGSVRKLTTALQYYPVESARSNFSIRAGVRLHDGKLSLLAGPRYRYLIPLDPWALRFTEDVVWTSDKKWQSRTRVDHERPLSDTLFYRHGLEGVWTEDVHGYSYAVIFDLRQALDGDRALDYQWVSRFETRPVHALIEELLVLNYRQRFWREWLFLDIAPQYRFPRDRGFEATPGILFRLEMVFGRKDSFF